MMETILEPTYEKIYKTSSYETSNHENINSCWEDEQCVDCRRDCDFCNRTM